MKNSKIIELHDSLLSIRDLKGVKFNYAIARNIDILTPHVTALQGALEITDEFKTYDAERNTLAIQHAKKDKDGNPVIIMRPNGSGEYDLVSPEKFQTALEALKNKHKKAVDARKKQTQDFEELLTQEAKIDLYKMKIQDIPEEITTEQMTNIYAIIDEKQ